MADRVGQQLGNYRLIRLLGRGGFAEVYLGQHLRLNIQAAIKILHTQLADDDIENFQKEAQIIASLVHPHIIRVLDFDVKDATPFLVMDYAPNGSLRGLHPKGIPLPLPTVISYVKQVADALQYAHDQKLIHRDVKPENMLVGRKGEIVLSDFGIAMIIQSSRYQTTQEAAGTISYMPPEQIQGKPRFASDQYALGVVVYEWLCGTRPFLGSFTEIATQHLFTPPPPLHEKLPTIPPAVEEVVLTALAKDPQKRFSRIMAFATALEQASQSTSLHPPASTVVAPWLSQVSQPDVATPTPNHPLLSTDTVATNAASRLPQQTDAVIPSVEAKEQTNTIMPSAQSSQSTGAAILSSEPAVSPPSTRKSVPLDEPQLSKRRYSRRSIIVGLAGITGLAGAAGGITWLMNSRTPGTTHPANIVGPSNIVWQTDNDPSGTYAALVDNYNKTNKDGIHVTWQNGPANSTDLLTTMLRARSSAIDLITIDTVYSATFAANGWTLPLDDKWPASDRANYFSGPIQSCTYKSQIVAAPLRTDIGVIYYRTDIVSTPPNTWDELVSVARSNASRAKYGYVWQGAQYEGLVCDFIEVLYGYGGSVLDPNNSKRVTVNSPQGVQALTEMVDWVGTISPISITTYQEETCRSAFQNGEAIFMRNWPYAYSLGNVPASSKVAGKFDIHTMPYGGNNTTGHSCSAGWNMAINAFSRNPEASWKFMQYLLGPYAQKQLAIKGSWTPTLKSVYTDAEVQQKQPLFIKLAPILENALPRPVSPVYTDLSNTIQRYVHQALVKNMTPSDALSALQSDLQSLVSQ